jgi:hypothetical protein
MSRTSWVARTGMIAALATLVPAGAVCGVRHDLHLSQTRLVVDGATVAARIRVFEDDLIAALTREAGARTPVVVTDSAMSRYLLQHVVVRANGQLLRGAVEGSGEETDAQNQRVRWAVLIFAAARPVQSLALAVTPFFELYKDQQNIVTAARGATGSRRSLLFTPGDDAEQLVRF